MAGSSRFAIAITALAGATAVAMGAFGAHALKPTLVAAGTEEIWRTAAQYHLAHSIALLAWSLGARRDTAGKAAHDAWVTGLWAVGIICFSGSLYALALGAPRWLGPITPLGGLALIAGWILAGWLLWRREDRA